MIKPIKWYNSPNININIHFLEQIKDKDNENGIMTSHTPC